MSETKENKVKENVKNKEAKESEVYTSVDDFFGQGKAQELPDDFKSGFVTLIGRPNAGKSTLLNAVMGSKIAITSSTAQTTRHRFRAVYNSKNMQMIMVDTPGIHKPHDALGEELNRSASQGIHDVDVIAFLVDASKAVGTGDEFILKQIKDADAAKVLVINKSDLVDEDEITEQKKRAFEFATFDKTVVVSALLGEGIDDFIKAVEELLPLGPRWFPEDMDTDQPTEVIVAEFIREKILNSTYDEIPHAVGVMVDEMDLVKKKDGDLYRIYATIYVEHDSQKGIIIGNKGAGIKRIGTSARKDLEHFLGCRVFLDIKVKVKKNWRKNATQIRRFGYGDGI